MKKDVVVFIGKSGCGKNFLIDHMHYIFGEQTFHIVPQTSTRPMRQGEKEGHPYHFVNKTEFFNLIQDKKIIEYAAFNGWYYGTNINDLEDDKINILSANPAAARSLLKNPNLNTHVVLIECDDKKRIIRSLEREKYPDIREVFRRYDSDEKDFKFLDFPYYNFVNNDIKDLEEFERLVKSQLRAKKENQSI